MEQRDEKSGRGWIVALLVTIVGTGLIALLWMFPTSIWVWALACAILIFSIVQYFNRRYRYWRRANACFRTAGVLAFVPTAVTKANLEGIGAFEFASDSSPLVVLGFLGAGLYLAWLDSRENNSSFATAGIASTKTNVESLNSQNSVAGLTAGGNIAVNQGISEDAFLAVVDAMRLTSHGQADSAAEPREVDEELVWRLIEDIKDARRRLERENLAGLLASLQKSFGRSGCHWPRVLRTEAILLMAEEERVRISRLRLEGSQVDLTRLQHLLKELRDA